MANSTPIHHEARCGAHQPEPPGREISEALLRCARERHSVVAPSSRLKVTRTVNGPTFRRPTAVHPGGACG